MAEKTSPINQQLLMVSQYHKFDKVPEPTNGMRTLSLWSQCHSKSLLMFTLDLSGRGAVVVNNKSGIFFMPSFPRQRAALILADSKGRSGRNSRWR